MESILMNLIGIANIMINGVKSMIHNIKVDAMNFSKDIRPYIHAAYELLYDFIMGNKAKYTYAFLMVFFIASILNALIVFIIVFGRKVIELSFGLEDTNYKIAIALFIGAVIAM